MGQPTQNALVLPVQHGKFAVKIVPVPRPGPSDVLVKVESAAINPVEWKIQTYGVFVSKYPAILGTDAAGVVEEVGENVTNLAKGDKILFQGFFEPQYGTFQQRCLVPADITAKIPPNLSFDEAATVPLGIASVVLGMYNRHPNSASAHFIPPWEKGGLTAYAEQPAFIVGGAGSLGQCAIQMAKLSRFSPIITTASPSNSCFLESLGATHVIDRNLPDYEIISQINDILGAIPLRFVFDTISLSSTQLLAYTALAPSGTLVLTLPSEIKRTAEDNKTVCDIFASFYVPENHELAVALCQRLTGWLESGVLRPNKVEVLAGGLSAIPAGLEELKNHAVSATKLIIRPNETRFA